MAGVRWLGFFIDRAGAHEPMAAWAALSVLLLDGLGKIDLSDVGDGGKPGQDIGEFFFEVIPIVA